MNSSIFRKKSIERISSPEQLNDYIRVSNPGVWMILSAFIILLAGICVWGIFGRLETTVPAVALVEDGRVRIFIKEARAEEVSEGMLLLMEDSEFVIEEMAAMPIKLTSDYPEYALYTGNLSEGEWVHELSCSAKGVADGIYRAEILVESIAPMTFLFN